MYKIIKIFFFWRIGLLLVGYLGSLAFPRIANSGIGAISEYGDFDYWASLAQWDGGHYFDIASRGYLEQADYAFFPLYPLLTKIISYVFFGNILLSGLIVANISFLAFLLVFYRYICKNASQKEAWTTIITFLLFPTTFFAVSFYSESVFLLLIVLVFTFIKSKNLFLAAILSSFAYLARFVGVFLAISVFYVYFEGIKFEVKNLGRKFFYTWISFFGFLFYGLYLQVSTNDPFRFLSAQTFWQRSSSDPFSTIFSYFWAFIIGHNRPINDYFDFLAVLVFSSILILGIKKISAPLWIFSMLVILIPASTSTLTSMPRYVLASIGAFVIIGKYLDKRPYLKIPVWSLLLVLQTVLLALFINGYWVA